jgi:prolyl-tRNA editing enzyme YbaK/EbsC (Cys-tRNA(Pro) deacylase)
MDKNNITRFLNARKIQYELFGIPGGKPWAQEAEKYLNETANSMDWMHVSGGQIGLNIKIKVNDFLKLTNAKIAIIGTLIE